MREYRHAHHLVLRINHVDSMKESTVENVLNKHGKEGWGLVSVLDRENSIQLFMKKWEDIEPTKTDRSDQPTGQGLARTGKKSEASTD